MNIKKINLNLLIALDALLTEKNVSKAAEKIFITQPALSNALSQLRELFNDELLVRDGKRMLLTPLALEIAPKIKQALQQITDIVTAKPAFNPATSDRTFRMVMSDYTSYILLAPITQQLMQEAPHIKLQITTANLLNDPYLFSEGKVDLGIGIVTFHSPAIHSQTLFKEEAVCVTQAKNKALKNLTLKKYLNAKHLAIANETNLSVSITDEALTKIGSQRHIAIAMPHIISALHIVAKTSLITTVPGRLAKALKQQLKLDVQKPPFAIPSVTISLAWHQRFDADAGHRWLRQLLQRIAVEV